MRKVIISLIFVFIIVGCKPKDQEPTSNRKQLIECATGEDTYAEYKYDKLLRLISDITSTGPSEDDDPLGGRVIKYKGNEIVYSEYFGSDSPPTNYKRDGNVITGISVLPGEDEDGNRIEYERYEEVFYLNDEGYLIKHEIQIHRRGGSYEYSDNETSEEGDYHNITEYIYDKNGNLTKQISTVNSEKPEYEEYEYDNKRSPFTYCNTPKWKFMGLPGIEGHLISGEGSIKNNLTKVIRDGKVIYKYEYKYDDAGYPIQCTSYYNGEKIEFVTYRYKVISE